ncbi:MAG TPA: hypothetical protein VFE24_17375 [Pirellulales bacterium]|jgi:protocatechuate 3,4-dioxygenase beta subunit|nr:hypothetical protein [Pirellulales bacterium]
MSHLNRRELLSRAGAVTAGSLAAVGCGGLLLDDRARATEPSGSLGTYAKNLPQVAHQGNMKMQAPTQWTATPDNIWGPYFRKGAPFRAKITPARERGMPLVISGHVWALDKRQPLAMAILDVWQANAQGRYDNDDPKNPPADDLFLNRARLFTDENGYYEYETIHPGRYQIGDNAWRPSHIHYYAQARGYKPLVTQMYFKGDPMNAQDQFIKPSLIVDVQAVQTPNGPIEQGVFDMVLAPNS